MATYVMLMSFTGQGVKSAKESTKRADAFKQEAKNHGATVKDIFWTLGQYDAVTIVEAPDDVTMTALSPTFSTGDEKREFSMARAGICESVQEASV